MHGEMVAVPSAVIRTIDPNYARCWRERASDNSGKRCLSASTWTNHAKRKSRI